MRPPEVFVRELAPHEGQRLKRLSKQSKLASTRQRAMILLASNTLMSAPEIARMLLTDESHVRKVIHDFNRHGFESLRPRFRGGRPRRISTDDEQRIVAVAGARPDTLGVPYTRWSLPKLSRHLVGQGVPVSTAQPGRILARNGISLDKELEAEPGSRLRGKGGAAARALP
jgi:transposase